MSLKARRPDPTEHLPYFSRYIDLVPEGNILDLLETEFERLHTDLSALTPEAAVSRYAPDKWSVLEVIGHLCDTERVFSFRALHVARGDSSALPGFDQNVWMAHVDFSGRNLPDLLLEWRGVRTAALSLFRHLAPEAWDRRIPVSGHDLTPRACAYIIVGHALHHERILKNAYRVLP